MKRVWSLVSLLVLSLFCAQSAAAASGNILLSFGATYASAGGSAVHRGVDIARAPGSQVTAVAAGEVTFAGRVPGASGSTVHAVTIRREDGDLVTVMPLSDLIVTAGDVVTVGDALGSVAAEGDASSDEPHIHVSLRRNGVYLDPSPLLTAPAAESAQQQEVSTQEATAPRALAAPLSVTAPAPAVASAPAPAQARLAGAVDPVGARARVSVVRPLVTATSGGTVVAPVAAPAGQISPGVALAPSPVTGGAGTPAAVTAPSERWGTFLDALPRVAATPAGLAVLATSLAAVVLLFSRRLVERRIQSNPPVSDRFGSMLQHLRAGDTLCGLTSCSGLLPSQSRGRLAQRR